MGASQEPAQPAVGIAEPGGVDHPCEAGAVGGPVAHQVPAGTGQVVQQETPPADRHGRLAGLMAHGERWGIDAGGLLEESVQRRQA